MLCSLVVFLIKFCKNNHHLHNHHHNIQEYGTTSTCVMTSSDITCSLNPKTAHHPSSSSIIGDLHRNSKMMGGMEQQVSIAIAEEKRA
jgi:hypothetical protein